MAHEGLSSHAETFRSPAQLTGVAQGPMLDREQKRAVSLHDGEGCVEEKKVVG